MRLHIQYLSFVKKHRCKKIYTQTRREVILDEIIGVFCLSVFNLWCFTCFVERST